MRDEVVDTFTGDDLDRARWLPAYLPAWASRAENAARDRLTGDGLVLEVPPDQGLWCRDTHQPPLRTSTIASADWSGPLGSERGPQPFRPGLRVREEQPRFVGWLVDGGYVEIRCRMSLTHRSMAALWLAGWDEDPHDSGELCVVEVFGSAAEPGRSAEVGMGIKALRDPRLRDDVAAPRLPIDVADWHTYRVDWDDAEARFAVDGVTLRTCPRPPRYPLVLMIGVFDFPDGTETTHTPALEISRVAGTATREGQGRTA
ncbi:glycoside hydrolase family 16 protein [Actinotalea caeni]|uniref:glycoside hydrolase family 16 protein n=1 Tax=Actinotalea caeni TaxID=1348467 RepID=UPI0012E2ABD0|nr:glycoside hydrolase family 16 protein [Actinotalea caeni]